MRQRLIRDVKEGRTCQKADSGDVDATSRDRRHEQRPAGRRHHHTSGEAHHRIHQPTRSRSKEEDWQRADGGQ
jgi:hypothetical protein